MNITRFFTDVLGAKLRTPYRWGAINDMTNDQSRVPTCLGR